MKKIKREYRCYGILTIQRKAEFILILDFLNGEIIFDSTTDRPQLGDIM